MKQGNTSRTERGWEKMLPILEKELPQKKEKRYGLWLFLIGLSIVAASYLYTNYSDTDKKHLASSDTNSEIINIDEAINTNSKRQLINRNINESLISDHQNNPSKKSTKLTDKTIIKPEDLPSKTAPIINNYSIQKSNKVSTSLIVEDQFRINHPSKSYNTKLLTKPVQTPIEQVESKVFSSPILESDFKTIKSINAKVYLVSNNQAFDLSVQPTINIRDRQSKINFGIYALGGINKSIENLNIESGVFATKEIGKTNISLSAGIGKINFDNIRNRSAFDADQDENAIAIIDINASTPNSEINKDMSMIDKFRGDLDDLTYLSLNLAINYSLSQKIGIGPKLGFEKYFINNDFGLDPALNNRNRIDQSYNLGAEATLSFTTRLSGQLAYTKAFSRIGGSDANSSFRPNKVTLGLRYNLI